MKLLGGRNSAGSWLLWLLSFYRGAVEALPCAILSCSQSQALPHSWCWQFTALTAHPWLALHWLLISGRGLILLTEFLACYSLDVGLEPVHLVFRNLSSGMTRHKRSVLTESSVPPPVYINLFFLWEETEYDHVAFVKWRIRRMLECDVSYTHLQTHLQPGSPSHWQQCVGQFLRVPSSVLKWGLETGGPWWQVWKRV